MGKYDKMTDDDFDYYLRQEVAKLGTHTLLAIPGIYEILSEELNNDVLSAWESDHTEEEDSDEETDD